MSFIASSVQALDLTTMISDSISAHPEIKERIHVYRQVISDIDIAESGWRPSIDVEASAGLHNTKSPTTGNQAVDYDTSNIELSLTQNLFNGYDTTHEIEQNKARAQAALFEIFDIADNIALRAVQAYLGVLKQKRLYQLAFENVESHEFILTQIRERNSSGVGRRSQLQQTEGRVARAHASLIAQFNNYQDSLSQLHHILGRYVDPETMTEPSLPIFPVDNIDRLTDIALTQHPAMRVATGNISATREDYKRSLNSRYPTIDLRLATEYGDDIGGVSGSTEDTSLTVNLRYNLYRGGRFQANSQSKIDAVFEQKEFAARTRRQVINTLQLAWSADGLLSRQLEFLLTHTTKAQETTESYNEEFFIGQRDLIDLLDAENELNNAKNQYAEARFDAMAARYRVHEAMGQLFEATGVAVSMAEGELVIARLDLDEVSELPLPEDEDSDLEIDPMDQCDNSISGSVVNPYGCVQHDIAEKVMAKLPENTPPELNDDQFEVANNGILVITSEQLLANDIDAEGDQLKIIDVSQPQFGKLAFNENNNIIYQPVEGYVGVDSFTYFASDSSHQDASTQATVNISVSDEAFISTEKIQMVNFIYKTSELTEESAKKVDRIIQQLRARGDIFVEINTFTDSKGSEQYNIALSSRRAEALKKLLIANGIDSNNIIAIGRGEADPIAENTTEIGQAINRRGVFIFRAKPKIE